MFLTIVGPVGHEEETIALSCLGMNLGTVLRQYDEAIEACWINNRPDMNWRRYIPNKHDRVKVQLHTGTAAFFLPLFSTFLSASAAATAASVASAITVSLVVSAIGMGIQMALAPKPAHLNGDNSQSFGISGFQNTTGQGTPIPVCYGRNRVTPHIIASGIDVSADHKDMLGRVLYSIGDTGGDEYESISDVEIDNVAADQYEGLVVQTRLGSLTQTVIPEFGNTTSIWFDGRTIPWNDTFNTGSFIRRANTTNEVDRDILTITFPSGLWRTRTSGKRDEDKATLRIWYADSNSDLNNEANWHIAPATAEYFIGNPADPDWLFVNNVQSALYYRLQIDFPSRGDWTLRFLITNSHNFWYPPDAVHSATMVLYNIEEVQFTTDTYPGFALLALTNIPAKQIKSLQSMKVTCLVNGKKVNTPNGKMFSRSRQWIVRDLMTGPCGMDYEFDDSELDLVQWQNEAAYYDDPVPGHVITSGTVTSGTTASVIHLDTAITLDASIYFLTVKNADHNEFQRITDGAGTYTTVNVTAFSFTPDPGDEFTFAASEPRDCCDFILNQRKWDIDWVRAVAGEGRACVAPSGLLWKYLIEKPGDPNLLFCEPGNIIENTIQLDVSPPEDDPYNQILAEFRDETDHYNPALTQPVDGPDTPYPSVIQKAVHFDTVTRESQAIRECMIVIKRQFLERRKWSFISPLGKIVSEPLDIDWMSERQLGDIGAYTGILPAGSTTTVINLPIPVVLDPAKSYIMLIQKRDNTPAESRTVSTGPGEWIQVTVSSPYTTAPTEGSWFALGELLVDNIQTRCREITVDSDGRVKQMRSEYVPEIFTADPIPPKQIRRHFPYVSVPPIPLRDAAVRAQLVQRIDGSWGTVILYDVTPGLIKIASTNSAVIWPTVWIPITVLPQQIQGVISGVNSFQRYYFAGAFWQLTSGSGAGVSSKRKIVDFDPNPIFQSGVTSYSITLEGAQPPGAITGESCLIEWERFSDTAGFKVDLSTDAFAWSEVGRARGFHYEVDGGDQGGTFYYRFTPLNASEVQNKIARLVKGPITISGDLTAPPAPISVMAFATTSLITVEATFQLPMALDFAGIEILVKQFQYAGSPAHKVYANVPVIQTRTDATRENGTGGTVAIRKTVDIRNVFNYPPAPQLWDAQVRAYDYSGNKSAWVMGNDFYPQQLTQADIA